MSSDAADFDPDRLSSLQFPETPYTYSERDVALYALGIGACARDAVDADELKYVYHENGQQSIQLNNTVTVAGLHDKGKAAIVEMETKSYEKDSGALLCMNRTTVFLRGAGGFSKSSHPFSYSNYPKDKGSSVKIPKGQPFAVFEDCTLPSQALLYRLSGDYNPLHSDPMIAKIAGFTSPILHGLCTLGFAVRAIIKCICRGDSNMVKCISGRFLLHVYPGETLVTEMWLEGSRVIYQTKVKERSRAVLSGYVDLHGLSSSL